MHKHPAIQPLSINIASYDLIVLGAPVWASFPAPAMLSFLDTAQIRGKKLALFCCHGGGMGKALEKLKALLAGNTIAGEIDFVNPAKASGGVPEKLAGWVKGMLTR
jgi:multimeric flavodoxin WrbA